MKIAYIILAYNNPLHLQRLVKALDTEDNSLYIHIDKKADISEFDLTAGEHLYIEPQRERVYWGEFNQVIPVLRLLKEAVKTHHDYYVLLYGSDYPVKSNQYIENYLKNHNAKEFINLGKMPEMDKTLDRIDYHHFLEANRNNTPVGIYKRVLNQVIRKINLKRKLPREYRSMTLYGGCPWWILTEECIHYTLDFIEKNPLFVKFWKNTLIPDETFFHTIIGNSSLFNKNVAYSVMYTRWLPKRANPETITPEDIERINTGDFDRYNGRDDMLFARKFNDSSKDVIEIINKTLLSI